MHANQNGCTSAASGRILIKWSRNNTWSNREQGYVCQTFGRACWYLSQGISLFGHDPLQRPYLHRAIVDAFAHLRASPQMRTCGGCYTHGCCKRNYTATSESLFQAAVFQSCMSDVGGFRAALMGPPTRTTVPMDKCRYVKPKQTAPYEPTSHHFISSHIASKHWCDTVRFQFLTDGSHIQEPATSLQHFPRHLGCASSQG